MSKLFQRQLIREIVLFAILAIIMSFFFSTTLRSRLSEEFVNRGHAISNSIASSSIELILNRDASTIQSTIDQFVEAGNGVAYVYVANHQHELVAHTFVPTVPDEIVQLMSEAHDDDAVRDITIPGQGNFLDITTPILEGTVGFAHVGMDKNLIDETIRSVIFTQVGLIALIFLISTGVAYIQANRVSQPLIRLAEFARDVTSDKDFAQTALAASSQLAPIAQRNDEVGQLTQNFQQMVQEVIEREHKLELRSLELAQANQEITDLSKRLKVENIRLEAKLGATRQQSKARRTGTIERFKVEETVSDIVIIDDDQEPPIMLEGDVLQPAMTEPLVEPTPTALPEPSPKSEVVVEPVAQIEPVEELSDSPEVNLSGVDLTRYLQQLLLPTAYEVRQINGLEVAGTSTNQIGDHYDWLMQHGQIQIGIGNLKGDTLANGVLMLMTSSVVRSLLTSDENEQALFLATLQRTMNQSHQSSTQNISLALLDLRDDENLALGGQNTELIVIDQNGEATLVDPYDLGLPVGAQSQFKETSHIHFQNIQGVVVYSNNAVSRPSTTESDQLKQVQAIVSREWQASAQELNQIITEELNKGAGTNDFTLLVVKQK